MLVAGDTAQLAADYPLNAVTAYTSGNIANNTAAATIPANATKFSYLVGFDVTGLGATAAGSAALTITGLLGGTITYRVAVPAGATVGLTPLFVRFPKPLPSAAVNTAISVSLAALGAGNTNVVVNAFGFSQ
jgi:hypothetical protein